MAISIPDRVVVFDYGEVISRTPSPEAQRELADLAGVEPAAFRDAWDRHRDALDHGRLSVIEYWRTVQEDLGVRWSFSRLQQVWARDFTSWFDVDTGVVDLIGELHDGGTRLALLSNAPHDFGGAYRFSPFGELMERVFVSAEMGLLKPEPEIYRRAMSDLGVGPAQTIFIDNKLVNVEAAAELGITCHHFIDAAGLRVFLEEESA